MSRGARRLSRHDVAAAKVARLLQWSYRGVAFTSPIVASCSVCGEQLSVISLPKQIAAEQPDDTTHVCHPLLGGCNHGFALTPTISPPAVES